MTAIPATLESTAAGFEPAYSHVSTGGDRHGCILASIATVARTTLDDVFKAAEALGVPKTGPYYQYMTEEILSSIGASFGLVFTVWKEVTKVANLPDLSIALVRYNEDYEAGEAVVIHHMNSKRDVSSSQPCRAGSSAALFALGAVSATPGALDLLDRTATNAAIFLDRHQRGDFGTVGDEDRQANKDAIEDGSRILSSYMVGGKRLWIITEADRSSTTMLLPEEY